MRHQSFAATLFALAARRWSRTLRLAGLALLVALAASQPVFAQSVPEVIEYYATDHLGSIRVVFDPNGTVLARSDYLPFGEAYAQSGTLPRQRFTGQEHDDETGLEYFNARSLLARTGRFNRPDPLFAGAMGNPQGWNRYAYVGNNPMGYTDPSGETGDPVATFRVTIVGREFPTGMYGDHVGFWIGDLLGTLTRYVMTPQRWQAGSRGDEQKTPPSPPGPGPTQPPPGPGPTNPPPGGSEGSGTTQGGDSGEQTLGNAVDQIWEATKSTLQCAAENSLSVNKLLENDDPGFLADTFGGNDIATVATVIAGPRRLRASAQATIGFPVNLAGRVSAAAINHRYGFHVVASPAQNAVGEPVYYAVTKALSEKASVKFALSVINPLSKIKLALDTVAFGAALVGCVAGQ